jgi:hypothetical protein
MGRNAGDDPRGDEVSWDQRPEVMRAGTTFALTVMLAFRLLGVITLVCYGGLVATAVLIPKIQSALTSEQLQQLVVILILGAASGLLTAIVHLHFAQSLSSTEKAEWRKVQVRNPFFAVWYLWSVPGRVDHRPGSRSACVSRGDRYGRPKG